MVELNLIKNFLTDSESLSRYLSSEIVDIADIKRRIFLLERQGDTRIPDQFYRLALERDVKNLESIDDVFCDLLPKVAEEYLAIQTSEIVVPNEKQNDWQELITYLPPLFIKMIFLHGKKLLTSTDHATLKKHFDTFILPNTLYTSLPSSNLIKLENLMDKAQGFHDLHMHLNGSTEIDIAWQDFLLHPDKIYKELKLGFSNQMVKEQLEEESYLLDPLKFYGLLRVARRIRSILFDLIFPTRSSHQYPPLKRLLSQIVCQDRYSAALTKPFHPFQGLVYSAKSAPNLMGVEGLMYSIVLYKISERKNSTIASLFHFYLLIQGLANRLLVQQVHQKGFEQFQKITLNGLREVSEKRYDRQFFQMHGNRLKFLKFLEGRFSPKRSQTENVVFIETILKGWKIFKRELEMKNLVCPELKLVAHFIKKKDARPHDYIRYKSLREDTWNKGKVLSLLVRNHKRYSNILTGVDAASSEFDTPPEVFGPTFRALKRKKAFKHFTYHVGEDFFHLISGLRVVYEAIYFLDLQDGDRIGHGTATAISVKTWLEVVGKTIIIKKGEWLDNLIFVYHYSISHSLFTIKHSLIEQKINELVKEIYKMSPLPTIDELIKAWHMRKYCPMLVFSDSHSIARISGTYDLEEWNNIQNEKIPTVVRKIMAFYHDKKNKIDFEEVIRIKVDDILDMTELEVLQKSILKDLKKKEIVIETLPTSNVRIGYYKNYASYHFYNWIKWQSENEIPKLVVGTDDTGIFATNIFNEYANIWNYLVRSRELDEKEVENIVETLIQNGQLYRFA
jgi:hypothetical protein